MTKIISVDTVIVGGGIAGLSAAVNLYDKGVRDICLLTDAGDGAASLFGKSDRQSYLKLGGVGNDSDSPYRMAKALSVSGNMDGDIALVEANLSPRCFYRLLDYGLPFEQDEYGSFTGSGNYGDKTRRAVSLGPDTTGRIYRALEKQVKDRNITTYENHQVIRLVTDAEGKRVLGLLVMNCPGVRDKYQRFLLINAGNVVLACGGPGGLFYHEGYPPEHFSCLGAALHAGAKGQNLAEFSFALTAVRRSLIMKGAYQLALPRYVSTDERGSDVQEFLLPYFSDTKLLYSLQKAKADQWQFDIKKVRSDGASFIDLLVYHEIVDKGRHVFLDYRLNPKGLPMEECQGGTRPFERLKALNPSAYQILLEQQIDPSEQPIEIHPSMVHHNGGLAVDTYFRTTLDHLYAIGETAGSHGSLMPEGASLNQTLVSALRASEAIASERNQKSAHPVSVDVFMSCAKRELGDCFRLTEHYISQVEDGGKKTSQDTPDVRTTRVIMGKHMDKACAIYLDKDAMNQELQRAAEILWKKEDLLCPASVTDIPRCFRVEDLLITQICVLSALLNELSVCDGSHGAHLITNEKGSIPHEALPEKYRFSVSDREIAGKIQEVSYLEKQGQIRVYWRETKKIPGI
ncbi:MAG: FAD-binding protein [Lachnospiraceae bacterium]|nr:FAD-binding protein [Lachnospiraceae bacterium]